MVTLLLELAPCLLVGALLGRALPGLPALLAPPLIAWGMPIALAGLLLRSGLHGELLLSGALGMLGPALMLLLLQHLPLLRGRLTDPGLWLGSAVGNTAYWGLPVALALLPPAAIGHAISFDLTSSLFVWTAGPLLFRGGPARGRALLAALRESPASRGLLLALVLQLLPGRLEVAALLWWPARIVILIALTLVGMRLGAMAAFGGGAADPPARGVGVALAAKLLGSPLLMLLLTAIGGLPAPIRDAVVLQAAAPTAVSVLLLREAGGAAVSRPGLEGTARLVLGSTLLALATVPLWNRLLHTLPAGSSGWAP
jgi:hypothetical protein